MSWPGWLPAAPARCLSDPRQHGAGAALDRPPLRGVGTSAGIDGRGTARVAEAVFGSRNEEAAPLCASDIRDEVLPKSPAGKAVRYTLNQWEALSRFSEDGDLEIDNGATERANRDIAIGRGNWTFFGSDTGGETAAALLSFIAMCKRNAVEPFAWFRDVLSRIATHPINRIEELLPHNWKNRAATAQP